MVIKIFRLLILITAIGFSSCAKDDYAPFNLSSPETIVLDPTGNEPYLLTITPKNIGDSYEVSAEDPWLKIEKATGKVFRLSADIHISDKGPRTTRLVLKSPSGEMHIPVEQENLYVGKISQGGIIFWLNPDPSTVVAGETWPHCKGLVLSLEESAKEYGSNLNINNFIWKNPELTADERNDLIKKEIESRKDISPTYDGKILTVEFLTRFLTSKEFILPSLQEMENNMVSNAWAWFYHKYWRKTVNGFSDWYIPSVKELFPLFPEECSDSLTGIIPMLNKVLEADSRAMSVCNLGFWPPDPEENPNFNIYQKGAQALGNYKQFTLYYLMTSSPINYELEKEVIYAKFWGKHRHLKKAKNKNKYFWQIKPFFESKWKDIFLKYTFNEDVEQYKKYFPTLHVEATRNEIGCGYVRPIRRF